MDDREPSRVSGVCHREVWGRTCATNWCHLKSFTPLISQSYAVGCMGTGEGTHAILPKGRQQPLAANSAAGKGGLDPWSRRQDPTAFICCGCVLSHFSPIWLFAILWTVTQQAPLSMGFFRQEYWSGLPCPPPGDLPDSGIKPASPTLVDGFFTTTPLGRPFLMIFAINFHHIWETKYWGKSEGKKKTLSRCMDQEEFGSHGYRLNLKL